MFLRRYCSSCTMSYNFWAASYLEWLNKKIPLYQVLILCVNKKKKKFLFYLLIFCCCLVCFGWFFRGFFFLVDVVVCCCCCCFSVMIPGQYHCSISFLGKNIPCVGATMCIFSSLVYLWYK